MKQAERRYLARVASLPCACCGSEGPSLVHHIRDGQGLSQRASTYLTTPLCFSCHQGPTGVHGDRSMMRIYKTSELDMLAATIGKMADNSDLLIWANEIDSLYGD